MKVVWSGRIGSREGDLIGLCNGAREFRPCIAERKLREQFIVI